MDGFQVAEVIRRQTCEIRPTLIALTGYGQEEDMIRSKIAGFDYHLVKPVSLEQIREVLHGRRMRSIDFSVAN